MLNKNIFIYGLTLLIISLSGCQPKNDETSVFNNYLKSNFSRNIPTTEKIFVIFPKFGCNGCMSRVVNEFIKKDYLQNKNYSLIISNPAYLGPLKANYDSILIDSLGLIENYDLQIGNITVIKTMNEQIEMIFNINEVQDLEKLSE